MLLREVSNNILGHYVQIDKIIYFHSGNWLGELSAIEDARNSQRLSGKTFLQIDEPSRLYVIINLLNSYVKIYDNEGELVTEDVSTGGYFDFNKGTHEINLQPGYTIEINYPIKYANKVVVYNTLTNTKMPEYGALGELTRYTIIENGIIREDMNEEGANDLAYEQLKVILIDIIENYKQNVTEDELNNKFINHKEKATIIDAYNQLRDDDKIPYTTLINSIKRGGIPTITVITETLKYDIGTQIDLYSLIKAVDNEDGPILIDKNNTTIKTKLDVDNSGIYNVTYEVSDSDKNVSTKTIQIEIIDNTIPPDEEEKPLPPEEGEEEIVPPIPPETGEDNDEDEITPPEEDDGNNDGEVTPPETDEDDKEDVETPPETDEDDKEDVETPPETDEDEILPPETGEDDKDDNELLPPQPGESDEEDEIMPPQPDEGDKEDEIMPPETDEDDKEDVIAPPETDNDESNDVVTPPIIEQKPEIKPSSPNPNQNTEIEAISTEESEIIEKHANIETEELPQIVEDNNIFIKILLVLIVISPISYFAFRKKFKHI